MLGTWDPSSKRTSRKKPSSSGSKLNTPPPPSTSPGSYNPPGPSTSTAPGSPPIPGSYPEYFKPPTTGRPAISAASPFPDEVHISDVFSDPARPVQPPPPVHESPPFSLSPAAARYWRLRRTYRVPLVFGSIQEATEEVEEGGRTGGAETITGMIPQVAPPVPLIPCEGLLSPTFRPANPTLSALGLTGIREASDEGDSEGEQAENPADETRRRRAREKRKRQDKKRKEQRRQRREAAPSEVYPPNPLSPSDDPQVRAYEALVVDAEKALRQAEIFKLAHEEAKWSALKDRPLPRLLRRIRERHRPHAKSASHKHPWVFRYIPGDALPDRFFTADEPVQSTRATLDPSRHFFPLNYLNQVTKAIFILPHYPWGPRIWAKVIKFEPGKHMSFIGRHGLMWVEVIEQTPEITPQGFLSLATVDQAVLWAIAIGVLNANAAVARMTMNRPKATLHYALPKGFEIPTSVILPHNVSIADKGFPLGDTKTMVVPEEVILVIKPRREEFENPSDPQQLPYPFSFQTQFLIGLAVLPTKTFSLNYSQKIPQLADGVVRIRSPGPEPTEVDNPELSNGAGSSSSLLRSGPPFDPRSASKSEQRNPKIEALEEHFLGRYLTREPILAEIELQEHQREIADWLKGKAPEPGQIGRIREKNRATMHSEDNWYEIPFRYQFHFALHPDAFFTEDQPASKGIHTDDTYFPLRSLRFGAAYMFIDDRTPLPARFFRNAKTIDMVDARSKLMQNILIISNESTDDDSDLVHLISMADLGRDALWSMSLAVLVSSAEAERRTRSLPQSAPLYISLARGIRLPTWLVLPDNVKVFTDSFLPSGSPIDLETLVLQIFPVAEKHRFPLVAPMGTLRIWHHAHLRVPKESMHDLYRKRLFSATPYPARRDSGSTDPLRSSDIPKSKEDAKDDSYVEPGAANANLHKLIELGSYTPGQLNTPSKAYTAREFKADEPDTSLSLPDLAKQGLPKPPGLTIPAIETGPATLTREGKRKPHPAPLPTRPRRGTTSNVHDSLGPGTPAEGSMRIRVHSDARYEAIYTVSRSQPLWPLFDAYTNAEQYKIDLLPVLDLTRWKPPVDKSKGNCRGETVREWTSTHSRLQMGPNEWDMPDAIGLRDQDLVLAREVKVDSDSDVDIMDFVARSAGSEAEAGSDVENAQVDVAVATMLAAQAAAVQAKKEAQQPVVGFVSKEDLSSSSDEDVANVEDIGVPSTLGIEMGSILDVTQAATIAVSDSESDYPYWNGSLEEVLGPLATARIRSVTKKNKLRHHDWNHLLVSPDFDNLMTEAGLEVGILNSLFVPPTPIKRADKMPRIQTVDPVPVPRTVHVDQATPHTPSHAGLPGRRRHYHRSSNPCTTFVDRHQPPPAQVPGPPAPCPVSSDMAGAIYLSIVHRQVSSILVHFAEAMKAALITLSEHLSEDVVMNIFDEVTEAPIKLMEVMGNFASAVTRYGKMGGVLEMWERGKVGSAPDPAST